MPIIRVDYDHNKIEKDDVETMSEAIRQIVSKHTDIVEVFVYANRSEIILKADPIEVFVEMSAPIMEKRPNLMADVKSDIQAWKNENDFTLPINLTLIPMTWAMEIGI